MSDDLIIMTDEGWKLKFIIYFNLIYKNDRIKDKGKKGQRIGEEKKNQSWLN